jgi:excisionase family DNA binding protein
MSQKKTEAPVPRMMYTVEGAALRLSMSRTRVYALIKSGEIKSIRIGRLRRVPEDALTDYVRTLVASQPAT